MSKRRNKKPAGAADSFKVVNIIVDASATLPAKQEMLDTAREDLAGSNSQPTKAEMSAPEQKPLPASEVKPALPSSSAEKKSVKPKEKDDPPAAAPYDFRGLPEPEKNVRARQSRFMRQAGTTRRAVCGGGDLSRIFRRGGHSNHQSQPNINRRTRILARAANVCIKDAENGGADRI